MPRLTGPELAPPTGLIASYFGVSGGSNAYTYWVQAIYPSGKSILAASNALSSTNGPDGNNVIEVNWNAMFGAIGYNVYRTVTGTAPTVTGFLASVTYPGFSDKGQIQPSAALVVKDGIRVFQARYDFAVDGGADALITLVNSDTIPAGTVVHGGFVNSTIAFVGSGASISIGTSAGSSATSILAVTAITSLTLNAVVNISATKFKMSADGTVTITPSTALLTAGVLDIFLFCSTPIAP